MSRRVADIRAALNDDELGRESGSWGRRGRRRTGRGLGRGKSSANVGHVGGEEIECPVRLMEQTE